jgi:cyclophilin family peptidyl-prolyl cis-trans isomerase
MNRLFFLTLLAGSFVLTPSLAADKNPVVEVNTTMGSFKIELFPDKAPITVKNFLSYVDDKFYDDTLFHRVIPTFVIQGGGVEPNGVEKQTKAPIKNESDNGLSNERGTVAMARTRAPNSATSQFFINVVNNQRLDKNRFPDGVGYCVFGKVIEGMDVVDKIKDVERGVNDKPVKDVVIKSIRRVKQ